MARLKFALLLLALWSLPGLAQVEAAPDSAEGTGPYRQLILRGLTLIDGTGAPAIGPVDIVIENDRIARIARLGAPGVAIDPEARPELAVGGQEMDLSGHYALPGFVDLHAHIGGQAQGTPAEYVYKLWLGHGITTIRDPGSFNGPEWTFNERERSAAGEITAPRIIAYVNFGQGAERPITTAEQARRWVRRVAERGADGIKFFGARPEVLLAAIEEAEEQGLGTAMHHAQMDVARANVLATARAGLTSMEHWYGLPEALFADRTVQSYPADYNYADEYDRFAAAGRLWREAVGPDHPRWAAVRDELIELGLTLNPTFTIYQANRDFMAQRTAEWHPDYTLPSLWNFFQPSRTAHGSYWFNWSTADEVAWRDNFQRWMRFVNDYKNHGGRVGVGSDAGYIYKLYGFGFIQELELLQEAGFHPLEVIRAATLHGAETLGLADDIGSVEVGKQADLLIVASNPLVNFKRLLGTGAIELDENNEVIRSGGVAWTIRAGRVFDARELRADVREMVRAAWDASGETLRQPGVPPAP
ncbi:amidohydrolase family protein [Wenzhouxiangella marina]|uniref:Amidohydrolase n=1 Tax=Wenzhouxiangella marina TaxID=1579979 RepID=A0A0K0Y080_9GAMM|nr:amidohydrolase family protein [Wenzhouxiangella marina]AKS43271.1 Amidohydrolase [Wenzhouxiangella marina]MBB6087042.1 imidazolonepropionase-like amidohydrolase [Wenzhouxiangella marina]